MTVSSSTRKAGPFSCNGVLTSFPFTFKCFSSDDVRVVFTSTSAVESDLTLTSDYTISLNADQNASPGGTVETLTAYATGEKITVVSDVDFLQETDIQNQGGFYPEVIENALDKVTMLVQQVKEEVDRSIKVSVSSEVIPEDYLTQAEVAATNASASASAASASASAASASASSAAISAGVIDGFEWAGAWVTAAAYLTNNLVSESGTTYIALSDHTSGTFLTDYGNGLWAIFAQKGAAGAGTGDMLAANNLSEVNPAIARSNLSAAKSGANSDITSLAGLTTPLTVEQGGIGAVTLTANNVLLGNGTSAPQAVAPGAIGNVLTSDGTTWVSEAPAAASGVTLGTPQATTSGTTKDFGSLPAGIKQITISVSGISMTATGQGIGFRIGTGGSPDSSGYLSNSSAIGSIANTTTSLSSTSGFSLHSLSGSSSATDLYHGTLTLTLQDSSTNTWVASGIFVAEGSVHMQMIAGRKILSGALDIVRLYSTGTFDAGKVNIAYSL